jgi:hypothetical protein
MMMKKCKLVFGFMLCTALSISPACKNNSKNDKNSSTVDTSKKEEGATVILPTTADSKDTIKTSIKSIAKLSVKGARLRINYNSPAVRERTIWGGLVPYDKIWVTGAHMATSLESDKEFMIGKTKIPPGKYALFTIPGLESWTVIINKNWDQHQADEYKSRDDIVRIEVQPEKLAKHQERLMYEFDRTGEGAVSLRMKWEKLGISIPLEIL